MAYQKQNWIDYPNKDTPITAARLNHMEDGIESAYEVVELKTISSSAPSDYTIGDKYYNNDDNKIYTATDSGWDDGIEPSEEIVYVDISEYSLYYYDKNNRQLVMTSSAGGGGGDTVPLGSIFEYDGDEVPKGYEKVEDGPNVYSINEIKTNKVWIDGKPIYRKVFKGMFGSNRQANVNVSDLKIDTVVDVKGIAKSSYGQLWNIPSYYSDTSIYWTTYFIRTDGNITIEGGTSFVNQPYNITLEYTKTTD